MEGEFSNRFRCNESRPTIQGIPILSSDFRKKARVLGELEEQENPALVVPLKSCEIRHQKRGSNCHLYYVTQSGLTNTLRDCKFFLHVGRIRQFRGIGPGKLCKLSSDIVRLCYDSDLLPHGQRSVFDSCRWFDLHAGLMRD